MFDLAHPLTLRAVRERAGLSQRELAQRAGLAPTTIRNTEAGLSIPQPVHQYAIDRALRAALVVTFVREAFEELENVDESVRLPLVEWETAA